ncbi:alpha/beta hydrolase [Shinella zoogloeoides]
MPDMLRPSVPGIRPAAEPMTFAGTVGLFTAAQGVARPLCVLFASPWGLEEMCTRKFRRILCERLAGEGIASLRFDYPGTGDALDGTLFGPGMETWVEALLTAAHLLQERSGCARLLIVAEGIGAPVASLAADRLSDLGGIAFLAPVISGRVHLRELSAYSRLIDDKLGLKKNTEAAIEVAGIVLPQEIAAGLRGIDLMKLETAPAHNLAVFSRANRPDEAAFGGHLRGLGADVLEAPFEGFESLTSNPTLAVVPEPVVAGIVSWAAGLAPRDPALQPASVRAWAASHGGEDYVETAARLGRGERMFGILCAPVESHAKERPAVLFLSSGYDRSAGWARSTVEFARALAKEGIASLRFDCANVADSPPAEGFAGQVLYHPVQVEDVREALDFLAAAGMASAVVAGRCSGAYLGLQAAVADPRVVGVVAVNPIVFRWQEGRSVDEALENPVQTLEHYGRRLAEMDTLRRVLRGEIDVMRKAREVLGRLAVRGARPLTRIFGGVSPRERGVFADFRTLRERGVPVTLLYGTGELGLEELALFFGRDAAGLGRFGNMRLSIIPETDHNFTPAHARARYLDAIRSLASG